MREKEEVDGGEGGEEGGREGGEGLGEREWMDERGGRGIELRE